MVKKALLVGSSFSAAPLLFALKKRGLHVSVCGNRAADPCHQYADSSFYIDYSNKAELLQVVEADNFDYLVPSSNDASYMSAAWVAQQMGFLGYDHYEVATVLHTKNAFRQFTGEQDLPAPRHRRQKAGEPLDTGTLQFPLLVKPIDSFSGRGVTKVMSPTELLPAVAAALQVSHCNEVAMEEFIEGTLHSHSAFIHKSSVAFDFFVDEYCTVYPYQVNCSNHPSALPVTIRQAVRQAIDRLAQILRLKDGLLHTQFMVRGDSFWIIECMRRSPGDLYGSLVEKSTGIDYSDLYLHAYLDEPLPVSIPAGEERFYGRHTISTDQPLTIYTFSQTIPAVSCQVVPLKSSGERLETAPFDKLAILFAEYATRAAMLDVTPRLAQFVTIQSLEETYLERK